MQKHIEVVSGLNLLLENWLYNTDEKKDNIHNYVDTVLMPHITMENRTQQLGSTINKNSYCG